LVVVADRSYGRRGKGAGKGKGKGKFAKTDPYEVQPAKKNRYDSESALQKEMAALTAAMAKR